MSRFAFQTYLAFCMSFEKLKVHFGRNPKQRFAWGEDASESETYKKGPRARLGRSQTNKEVWTRKCVNNLWRRGVPAAKQTERARERKKKSKEPHKRLRKFWLKGAVSACGEGVRVLQNPRLWSRAFYRYSQVSEFRLISLIFILTGIS